MFNVGTAELLVILLVALLVLGPNKLPDAARQVGKALGELRRLSSGFQAEMRDALREPIEGTPASGSVHPPARSDGALSSPKSSGVDAGTTPPAPAGDGAGTAGATVEQAAAGVDSERGGSGEGGEGGEGGTTGAPTGHGGAATSPPARDAGANGSTPT